MVRKLQSHKLNSTLPSSGQLSGALLVPFSLHRWSSEPSLAHCSLAGSSSQPPSSCSTSTTSSPSSVFQTGNHPFTRTNPAPNPPPSVPAPLRRSESMGRRPLLRHPNPHIPQRDSDYELEPERGRKRAIDNQYMLLWYCPVQHLHHLWQSHDHAHVTQTYLITPPSSMWVCETLIERMKVITNRLMNISEQISVWWMRRTEHTHTHSLRVCLPVSDPHNLHPECPQWMYFWEFYNSVDSDDYPHLLVLCEREREPHV